MSLTKERQIVYRFLSLPTHRQRQIALKLGLWSEEEDWNLIERTEREIVIFGRVRQRDLIHELAAEIGEEDRP